MPIEIKELHIKINVDEKPPAQTTTSSMSKANTDQVIKACVEQIMNIESRKKER